MVVHTIVKFYHRILIAETKQLFKTVPHYVHDNVDYTAPLYGSRHNEAAVFKRMLKQISIQMVYCFTAWI